MIPRRLTRTRWQGLATLIACVWLVGAHAAEGDKAGVVLRNGKIYTADPARSIQQSLAFTGNTIVAVGSDKDVAALIGPKTTIIDLKGKLILPGLIDTHIHPIFGAVNGSKCSLTGVKATIDALKPVIQACLAKDTGGADDWFEVVQLDNYGFSATAKDLDQIEATRPLALWGNDGHTVWVNASGLALLGVTAATPDPPGGKITRAPERNWPVADSSTAITSECFPTRRVAKSPGMPPARQRAPSPTAPRFSSRRRFRRRRSRSGRR